MERRMISSGVSGATAPHTLMENKTATTLVTLLRRFKRGRPKQKTSGVTLPVIGGLHFEQARILASRCDQLLMASVLGDASFGENHDSIREPHGREAMRNQDRHSFPRQLGKIGKHL